MVASPLDYSQRAMLCSRPWFIAFSDLNPDAVTPDRLRIGVREAACVEVDIRAAIVGRDEAKEPAVTARMRTDAFHYPDWHHFLVRRLGFFSGFVQSFRVSTIR